MKILIISLFVTLMLTQVYSEEEEAKKEWMKAAIPAASKRCKKETGISQETIDKARNGEIDDKDETLKKHLECFYGELNILHSNQVQKKELKSYLNLKLKDKTEEEIEKAVNDCKEVKGSNDKETATELAKCINEHK